VTSFRIVNHGTDELQSTTSSPGAASLRSPPSTFPRDGSATLAAAFTAAAGLVRTGVGRYALEIIADEIRFLTPKPYRAAAAEAA
jgi:hypothetical protein